MAIHKLMSLILAGILTAGVACRCHAQPPIPMDKIPEGIPADVRKEIEGLYSGDERDRGRAARNLGGMGEKAVPAIPFLIGLLNPEDFSLGETISPGQEACLALLKIGRPATLPLIEVMKEPGVDPLARQLAADLLGSIRDPRAVEPLIGALNDESRHLRLSAITALKQIRDPRAVEPLIELLKEQDYDIYNAAALSLKSITGKDFGRDPGAWRNWRERNKDALPKDPRQ